MQQLTFSRLACLAVAIVLAVSAVPRPSAAADAFEINAILSLTGPGSFLGKNEQLGLELVQDSFNKTGGISGRPVKFNFADDQSNPQVALQLANGLIAKKVTAIVGTSLAAGCNAIQAIVKNDGPLLYCLSAGFHPDKGTYGFTYGISTRDLIAVNMRYFRSRGLKKIALITSTDASGQDGEAGIDEALARPEFKDMQLVAREHYGVADQTVTAQMSRIKASGAQALFGWGTGSPIGTVLRAYQDLGMTIPIGVSASNLIYSEMQQFASIMPAGFVSAGLPCVAPSSVPPGSLRTAVLQFIDALKAVNEHPDVAKAISWDPGSILIGAYRKLGANATPAQIRDYISGLHGFSGANGDYDFRDGSQRGLTEKNAIMVRWDAPQDTWVAISKFGGIPLK
jgi:branched-chain amino acid transport system substrate-binding protein